MGWFSNKEESVFLPLSAQLCSDYKPKLQQQLSMHLSNFYSLPEALYPLHRDLLKKINSLHSLDLSSSPGNILC